MKKSPPKRKPILEDVPRLIEELAVMTAKGFERIEARFDKMLAKSSLPKKYD